MLDLALYLAEAYTNSPAVSKMADFFQIQPENRGLNRAVGLIETAFDGNADDLIKADILSKRFVRTPTQTPSLIEHGTFSTSLLAAQGQASLFGLAPKIHLLVATVARSNGYIDPNDVIEAIEWFTLEGVEFVAIPLGDSSNHDPLTAAIEKAAARGVVFFAAAGNLFPEHVTFPARLPGVNAVGACDSLGNLRLECCRSPHLEYIMPGTEIPAIVRASQIETRSGSSVACVVAVGLAALSNNFADMRL